MSIVTRPETLQPQKPELTAAGDLLQSSASRVAEWIEKQGLELPYEVYMAHHEVKDAVEKWTEARRKEASA